MRTTIVGVVLVVALLVSGAGSSLASVERVATCEHEESLGCQASGKVRHPRRLSMTLRSHDDFAGPSGPSLNVDWATVCFKWSGRERKDGYYVGLRTPIEKQLPMAYWRPDSCRVRVYTTRPINVSGGSKLVLRARV